jgi:LysM repeat protein
MVTQARFVPHWIVFLLLTGCQSQPGTAAVVSPTATLLPLTSSTATRTMAPPPDSENTTPVLGPTPTPFVHIVQQGETLLGISFRYGVDLDALLLVNPGVDPGFLTIGQQLRIPGSDGEPVDYLLPTPTPVPLSLGPVSCYDSPSGRMVCLLSVENGTAFDLESVAVLISLFDSKGNLVQANMADSPLELLSAGDSMPVSAAFSSRPQNFQYVSAEVRSAIAVPVGQVEVIEMSLEVNVQVLQPEIGLAHLEGEVLFADGIDTEVSQVRILGIVRDALGRYIGYNLWDSPVLEAGVERVPFSLDVYSLGPRLAGVELHAQGKYVR